MNIKKGDWYRVEGEETTIYRATQDRPHNVDTYVRHRVIVRDAPARRTYKPSEVVVWFESQADPELLFDRVEQLWRASIGRPSGMPLCALGRTWHLAIARLRRMVEEC